MNTTPPTLVTLADTEQEQYASHLAHPESLLTQSNHKHFHLDHIHDPESVRVFLQRVGKIPLVSGVVRAYERGKDTSKMVRYGADLVESSVNSLSDTVVSKVGPERIAQIDRYAGAALDRLGQFGQPQQSSNHQIHYHHHHHHYHHLDHFNPDQYSFNNSSPLHQPFSSSRRHQLSNSQSNPGDPGSDHANFSDSTDSFHQHQLRDLDHPFQTADGDHLDHSTSLHPNPSPRSRTLVQVSTTTTTTTTTSNNSKSCWQNILVEAGMTAGGIGAAVSEESMKSLQYCLHWLHYATAHLDHQITVLRNLISSLNEEEGEKEEEEEEASLTYGMRTMEAVTRLAGVKKEVVETIRKVVDVVSKYARVGLPEPAKQFVRKSILGLPLRWASAIHVTPFINYPSDLDSGERDLTPIEQPQSHLPPTNSSYSTTQIAAHRILTLAVESLNMLKSITGTFSESVERADAWIQRLRVIGFQNRNNQDLEHQSLRQHRWESNSQDMDEEEEGGEEKRNKMEGKSGKELKTKNVQPRPISLERYHQVPSVRSRNSSRSSNATFEEDNISLLGSSCCGCNLSTVGSMVSSNTTLTTPCTFNNKQFTYQELAAGGSVDRSAAKRRKANGNLIDHLHPTIIDSHPSFSSPSSKIKSMKVYSLHDDDEEMKQDENERIWKDRNETPTSHAQLDSFREPNFQNLPLSSPYVLNTPSFNLTHSNSLKKILLDIDQVNHLDLQLSHAASSPAHIRLHQTS